MEATDIMNGSKRWLKSCDANAKNKLYGIALYSLEMSVEMALKAVLYKLGMEVPKAHNIAGQIRAAIRENRHAGEGLKARIDKITDVFSALIEYRAPSGYAFEYNYTENEFKRKLGEIYPEAKEIVELCDKFVSSSGGK